MSWTCRGPCCSTHWPCRRSCRAPTLPCRSAAAFTPRSRYKKIVSRLNPCRAHCTLCRSVPAPCRRALLRCIAVLQHKRSPPATIQNFYRYSPPAARPCARAVARPARRPAVSQGLLAVSWSCRGRVVTRCWQYRGLLLHTQPNCVTIRFSIS